MKRRRIPSDSPMAMVVSRLERVKAVASDFARIHGVSTPSADAMADFVTTEIDTVLNLLGRLKIEAKGSKPPSTASS